MKFVVKYKVTSLLALLMTFLTSEGQFISDSANGYVKYIKHDVRFLPEKTDTIISINTLEKWAKSYFPDSKTFHLPVRQYSKRYSILTIYVEHIHPKKLTYQPYLADTIKRKTDKPVIKTKVTSGFSSVRPFVTKLSENYSLLGILIENEIGEEGKTIKSAVAKVPYITLHGNIAYTFDYRTRLDTPFVAKNLQQHNEQIYADAVLKGKYPFRVILNSRQSNSPFFKNYTDVSIQFNYRQYQKNIKEELLKSVEERLKLNQNLSVIMDSIEHITNEIADAEAWVKSPRRIQEIIEEKEKKYADLRVLQHQRDSLLNVVIHKTKLDSIYFLEDKSRIETQLLREKEILKHRLDSISGKANNLEITQKEIGISRSLKGINDSLSQLTIFVDSILMLGNKKVDSIRSSLELKKDSILSSLKVPGSRELEILQQGKIIDSLKNKLKCVKDKYDSLEIKHTQQRDSIMSEIKKASNPKEFEKALKSAGQQIDDNVQKLLAITEFGIGRSQINYSDLTINNISVNGINIVYNPSMYYAFVAGSVDYQFRDFVFRGKLPKQKVVAGRIGFGNPDHNACIFTFYNGTKTTYGVADSNFNSRPGNMNVVGYSVEIRHRFNKYTDLSAEIAKSSNPYISSGARQYAMKQAFDFEGRSNEAYSVKFNSEIPLTKSFVQASYKRIGANFQSFSVFNTGVSQENWLIKVQQNLFGNKVTLMGQIRRNGFENPMIAKSYNSTILFKSIQGTLRLRKWPVVVISYMPSSQITKGPGNEYQENIYYTFISNAFYAYRLKRIQMVSNVLFTRFYNRATDTGFVHYNAKELLYSHQIQGNTLLSQSSIQLSYQPSINYVTVQQLFDWRITTLISAGLGAKGYRTEPGAYYFGGTFNASLNTKWGGVKVQYDKGYLPDAFGKLQSNDWGRVTWFKIF